MFVKVFREETNVPLQETNNSSVLQLSEDMMMKKFNKLCEISALFLTPT